MSDKFKNGKIDKAIIYAPFSIVVCKECQQEAKQVVLLPESDSRMVKKLTLHFLCEFYWCKYSG